jgi:hypothetical protein
MLANGYVPLANKEKMTLIKGWTGLKVDEAMIDDWDDKLAYQSTGLRIDAPLVAIDIDIDDAEIVEELWAWAVETWGLAWSNGVMIRFGGGRKECWVCKIDEPFKVPPGPKYVRPEDDPKDPEATTHKVELFGGVSGRQIGAYGWHTTDVRRYEWAEGNGPAEVPLRELPVISKADLFKISMKYADLLEARGWHLVTSYNPEDWHGVEKVYDIPPGLVVKSHSRGELCVEELREGDRVRMAEISGTGTNTTRGIARHTHEGVAIWDTETGVTHCLESAAPKDIDEQHNAMGEKLLAVYGQRTFDALVPKLQVRGEMSSVPQGDVWKLTTGVEFGTWAGMHQLVRNFQQRYAHFPSGNQNEEIVDTYTGVGYRKSAFIAMYDKYIMTLPKPEDPENEARYHPVKRMLSDEATTIMYGYKFDPNSPARLIEAPDEEMRWLNLYEPPTFGNLPPDPTAGEWFGAFLDYLIPDEVDRRWLLNWMAYKVQNPGARGAGVILVTPTQGTGRNVLMKMLTSVLNPKFCRDVSAGVLLGTSGQSQFGDVMLNTVLLTCDEIAMEGANYDRRLMGYESLKSMVDPFPQTRTINRKGLSSLVTQVCYSTLMASNHAYDALPLAKGDRRFAVLYCTRDAFAETPGLEHITEIVDRVLPMGALPNASAIYGLREYLLSIPADKAAFHKPPLNEAKETMIEENEGHVEKMMRLYIDKLPAEQPCFWFADMVARCTDWLEKEPRTRGVFEKEARKKLKAGFAGWTFKKDVRVSTGPDTSEVMHNAVSRDDAVDVTPQERARWLGDGPTRGA